jgi:hypothetical protein
MDQKPTPPSVTDVEINSIESQPAYFADTERLDIKDAKLTEIGKRCKARLDELKSLRSQSKYEEERQKDFDSYHLVSPRIVLPYKGYPNLACPLPRIGVDTFHANVLFTFGGQEGQFKVLPDFLSKSHMDVAKRTADYMTYCLNYEAGFYTAIDKADMDCNKYNNGFLKARYVCQYEWQNRTVTTETVVPQVDPLTGEVTRKVVKKKKTERKKVTTFDGVKVERVAPMNVFASPMFDDIEEAVEKDYLFEIGSYSTRFLKENSISLDKEVEPFFDPKKVDQIKAIQRSSLISRFERNKQQYDGVQIDRAMELLPIELGEAHFREDVNDDGIAENVAVIFDTETGIVLRASYNKCRMVKLTPRPVDGRWEGESIRKSSQSLVTEWEAIHNQRVAKGQWSNLPFFFYKAGGRFNPQMLTLSPGKGYPMDDPSSINFPQPPAPDQSYFNEEKLLLDYFDRVLGLGDVIQGVQRGNDASATNTIQSVQRAGIRLATPINRIGFALEKLVAHMWELNKQCAPEIKEFKVAGVGDGTPVFDKVTSKDYDTLVSFKLNMATMYDVQMLRDSALLNYKTFISNPFFMNNPASMYQLTQETMQAVGLKVKLPAPDQAKSKSPFEEHDLMEQGVSVEPVLGEDVDEHLAAHMAMIKSKEFEDWTVEQQAALFLHYDKTQILKQTLQSANLNQSGVFEGMNGPTAGPQAAMTATRNPSQTFNNLRVGNTPKGQNQNVQNGITGASAPQPNAGGY